MNLPFQNLGIAQIQKMAQELVEKQQQVYHELQETVLEGSSGGGVVKAKANGLGHLLEIEISKEVVNPDEVELLQDLVLTAVRDVLARAQQLQQEKRMAALGPLGGMVGGQLPGLF